MPDFTQKNTFNVPRPESAEEEDEDFLFLIEGHLHSIRKMLTFFVVLTIIGIIVQILSALRL